VFGVIAGVGVLGLAVGSELTKDHQIPSLPIGIGATALTLIAGPVVAVGAGSARHSGARGVLGLRIAGWLGYALTLADAGVLIGLGVAQVTPPDGTITSVGLLGATSLILLSADAFASAGQASDVGTRPAPSTWARLVPTIGTVRDLDGVRITTLGLSGPF
jgi:hypothetical protein